MALAAGALLEPPQKITARSVPEWISQGMAAPSPYVTARLAPTQSGGEVIRSSFGQDACRVLRRKGRFDPAFSRRYEVADAIPAVVQSLCAGDG